MIYIVVNKHHIAANAKLPEDKRGPIFSVRWTKSGRPVYGKHVHCLLSSTLIYDHDHPLKCGARAWVTTEGGVIIDGVLWSEPDFKIWNKE